MRRLTVIEWIDLAASVGLLGMVMWTAWTDLNDGERTAFWCASMVALVLCRGRRTA